MLLERRASAETAKTVQNAQRVLSVRIGGLKTSGRMSRALDQNGSVLGNSTRTFPQDLWNIFGTARMMGNEERGVA